MPTTTLTYPLTLLLLGVLAGVSFLGVDHVLSGEVVAGIYTGVLSAVTVGHYSTKNNLPAA